MSVAKSLHDYLTDTSDTISGNMGNPFAEVQRVAGLEIRSRMQARQHLQSLVSNNVYYNRHPQELRNKKVPAALTVRTIDSEANYVLGGEANYPIEYLVAQSYCETGKARDRATTVIQLLRLCVSGFHKGKWGTLQIGECLTSDEISTSLPPIDGSDQWVFLHSVDLQVYHRGPVAIST